MKSTRRGNNDSIQQERGKPCPNYDKDADLETIENVVRQIIYDAFPLYEEYGFYMYTKNGFSELTEQ